MLVNDSEMMECGAGRCDDGGYECEIELVRFLGDGWLGSMAQERGGGAYYHDIGLVELARMAQLGY